MVVARRAFLNAQVPGTDINRNENNASDANVPRARKVPNLGVSSGRRAALKCELTVVCKISHNSTEKVVAKQLVLTERSWKSQ